MFSGFIVAFCESTVVLLFVLFFFAHCFNQPVQHEQNQLLLVNYFDYIHCEVFLYCPVLHSAGFPFILSSFRIIKLPLFIYTIGIVYDEEMNGKMLEITNV